MHSIEGPITAYRRFWLPEAALLGAAAVITTVLFAVSDIDITAGRWFYYPGAQNPWPVADNPLWSVCYRSAPWVTASLAFLGSALFILGVIRAKKRTFRLYGAFILLSVILGPGFVINVILKDHWGRPRPRQITELGGGLKYVPPLVPSGQHGKSFPCGHCSVGYLYAEGWWVWRRRHPRWAAASLVTGLLTGTLLGLGRMAGGAHFLSDAIWSALIAYTISHVLYYYVLRIPAREDGRAAVYPVLDRNRRLRTAVIAGTVVVGLGIIGGGILASPIEKDLACRVRLSDYPMRPRVIEFIVGSLDTEIDLVSNPEGEIGCSGIVHGFGLPTNEIIPEWTFKKNPVPILTYRVVLKGLFTDLDGTGHFRIPLRGVETVRVRTTQGDIRVKDLTGGGLTAAHLPKLDLSTVDGKIQRP